MSKEPLKFKDLEYIVMEGGGARGAAYLGAIRALEKLMRKREQEDPNIYVHQTAGRTPGLLDYYQLDSNGNEVPVIKGIAGSSAGAITTFALALGFNSDEIEGILKYDFKNFLKDADAGKYRMITEDGMLAIGQDKKNKATGQKELAFDIEFKFDFAQNFTRIGDNWTKRTKRELVFSSIAKAVIDGAISNVQQLVNLFARIFKVNGPEDVPSFWRNFFRWLSRPNNYFLTSGGVMWGIRALVFLVLIPTKVFKVPMKLNPNEIMCMLEDRGMFSGFKVREFFMDMVILAAVKDTRFHRGFIQMMRDTPKKELGNYFGSDIINEDAKMNVQGFSSALFKYANNFDIGKRASSGIGQDKDITLVLTCLSRLTFKGFNKITQLNYGACVSNFTTGFPVYFGHEWTPNFRIMEAVAGSMSIPPAIRPLYNASNVVKSDPNEKIPFLKPNGKFELADYYLYEHAVKMAIQGEIQKDEDTVGTVVNVNNTIDVSAFLPKLREIVNGKYKHYTDNTEMLPPDLTRKSVVVINGKEIIVDYALYKFFYNAAYKGLFMDGGYRNNIPFNFFRLREDNIDHVMAIKLDEHFPPTLLENVYNKIKNKLDKVETSEIIADIDLSELDISQVESGAIMDIFNSTKPAVYKTTKAEIIELTKVVFREHLEYWVQQAANNEERAKRQKIKEDALDGKKDNKAIKKLVKSTIKHYRKTRLVAPWMEPVSILGTAFEGYAYGSEKGQVRHITDHNQILPLYDYGVGTYDFDMRKKMPMINLAQAEGESDTLKFFT